jgi:hypothetical protein
VRTTLRLSNRQARAALTFAFAGWISLLGAFQDSDPNQSDCNGLAALTASKQHDRPTRILDSSSPKVRDFTQRSSKRALDEKQVENSTHDCYGRHILVVAHWTEPVFIATPERLVELSGTPPPALG